MQIGHTVAAISTPLGKGGIAVVRISGSECYDVAAKVFAPFHKQKSLHTAKGYTALYGSFLYRNQRLDEGIALCFRAPHSYTGEDVVELSCHGGEVAAQQLLLSCLEAGAQPAAAGEFTKRGVINGRLSLTQAEAVMDVISATSRQGLAMAQSALEGVLYKEIMAQKQKLLALAAHLAAYTDFPEEDVEILSKESFRAVLQDVQTGVEALLANYDRGAILRRGVHAAIVGSPNVGKSTLFNLLSGFERAIVTPVAGTTRDVVQEQIQLGGVRLLLSDTAGLHQTNDIVEAEGIRRSYAEIQKAALVLAVFDGSESFGPKDEELAQNATGKISLAIINKGDLPQKMSAGELVPFFTRVISVSAHSASARDDIQELVLELLKMNTFDTGAPVLANERQLWAAKAARDALAAAQQALLDGMTFDAAGVYLEDALGAFATLTGEGVSEQVLDEVFSTFCVGK